MINTLVNNFGILRSEFRSFGESMGPRTCITLRTKCEKWF